MPTSFEYQGVDHPQMSFSGSDCAVYAYVNGPGSINQSSFVQLKALQTISVSMFRDKIPVRALGYVNTKGHTRGPRTIGGSMIYTIMNDHPLKGLFQDYDYDFSYDEAWLDVHKTGHIFPDVIPPFNMMLMFNNELGSSATVHLFGVDITNDGVVSSIEDLITEKAIQYRARDMRVFKGVVGSNGLPVGDTPNLEELQKIAQQQWYDMKGSKIIDIPVNGTFNRMRRLS